MRLNSSAVAEKHLKLVHRTKANDHEGVAGAKVSGQKHGAK